MEVNSDQSLLLHIINYAHTEALMSTCSETLKNYTRKRYQCTECSRLSKPAAVN